MLLIMAEEWRDKMMRRIRGKRAVRIYPRGSIARNIQDLGTGEWLVVPLEPPFFRVRGSNEGGGQRMFEPIDDEYEARERLDRLRQIHVEFTTWELLTIENFSRCTVREIYLPGSPPAVASGQVGSSLADERTIELDLGGTS